MKPSSNEAVENALQSLDNIERAAANPFLYSKIRHRMQVPTNMVPTRLAWRLAGVLVLAAVINTVVLLQANHAAPPPDSGTAAIATEYSITIPQSY